MQGKIYLTEEYADTRAALAEPNGELWESGENNLVLFMLCGSAEVYAGGKFFTLGSGEIAAVGKNRAMRALNKGDGAAFALAFTFGGKIAEGDFDCEKLARLQQKDGDSLKPLKRMLVEAAWEGNKNARRNQPEKDSAARKILSGAADFLRGLRCEKSHAERQKADRMDGIVRDVCKNFCEHTSLAGLAERYHVDYCYLSRFFKKTSGKTYSGFLDELRLEYAAKMLGGDAGVTETAYACGFADVKSFTAAFKRRFGGAPAKLKKALGEKLKEREKTALHQRR